MCLPLHVERTPHTRGCFGPCWPDLSLNFHTCQPTVSACHYPSRKQSSPHCSVRKPLSFLRAWPLVGVCFHRCAGLYFLFSRLLHLHSPAAAPMCQREQILSSLPHFSVSLGDAYHFGAVNNHAFPSHPTAQLLPNSDYPSLHLPPHAALYTSCESICLNQDIHGKLPLLLIPVGFATPASD